MQFYTLTSVSAEALFICPQRRKTTELWERPRKKRNGGKIICRENF